MATTDLIQLKQTTANRVTPTVNGDFQVNLQQKIVVNPGDQIAVQQSFIDTSSIDPDSGMINVPEDCELQIINGLYIQDVITTPNLFRNLDDTVRQDGDYTGETFIACFENTPDQEVIYINQITLTGNGSIPRPGTSPPDIKTTVTYKYTDVDGGDATVSYDYDFGDEYKTVTKTFKIGEVISYRPGTLTFSNTTNNGVDIVTIADVSYINTVNGQVSPSPGLVEDPDLSLAPFKFTTTIKVPANKYSPDNLVSTLNTLLQKNTPDANRLVNSGFLATTSTDLPAKLQVPGVDPADQKEVFFVNSDASKIFKIDGQQAQLYVGTNNFAFGWEATQGVFTIDYAHFPYINNADGSDAIALIKTTNIADGNTAGDYVLASKYGGIFFLGFSDNLSQSLIYTLMNFNGPGTANPITANIGSTDFTIGLTTGKAPTFTLTEGVSVTTQLVTLDSFVNKKQGGVFYEPPVDNNNQIKTDFFSQAPFTQQILAQSSALKNSITDGYFLVEIQAQFTGGAVHTEDGTLKFIRQVVGRFFTQNSYTTGESGQIVYTHASPEPLIINSFRVRVLDPNLSVATNLGPGSTIFLAHARNPQQSIPLEMTEGKVGAKATAKTTM